MIYKSYSESDTRNIARELGEKATAGEVYALTGDLGTGKTVFAQGFAEGLGITGIVNSPTFTIVQEYVDGRLPFYHFDVYRIGDVDEMIDVGFDDYIYGDGVSLIEWGELINDLLPENVINISLTKDNNKGFEYRKIVVER